jgi:drug/metabolite transporter (DMT)-like permease
LWKPGVRLCVPPEPVALGQLPETGRASVPMHHLNFLTLVLVWGSNFILMKRGTDAFHALEVAFGRVLGGALVLAAVLAWRGKAWEWRRLPWRLITFCTLLGYVWPYFIQPVLVARHGGAFIGLSVAFVPLLTILVSIPLLRVWPTPQQVVGVLGALACIAGLMWDGLDRNVPPLDLLAAFSVPTAYAIVNTLVRKSMNNVPSLQLSVAILGIGTLALAPAALWCPSPADATAEEVRLAWMSVFVLGVLGTGWGTLVFNGLIQAKGPLFAGMATYLVPLIALAWGWYDRESVTPTQVACLFGVLVMVAIAQFGSGVPLRRDPNRK